MLLRKNSDIYCSKYFNECDKHCGKLHKNAINTAASTMVYITADAINSIKRGI